MFYFDDLQDALDFYETDDTQWIITDGTQVAVGDEEATAAVMQTQRGWWLSSPEELTAPAGAPQDMTTVYRIQPAGLGIAGHRSETSSGHHDDGCHVFLCLDDAKRAVRGWMDDGTQPELLTITCTEEDLDDNGDYEGLVLLESAGTITHRQPFADWDALYDWASGDA